MLAPREKLWAAPPAVVDAALRALRLTAADVLADYGCGDGVALLAAASTYGCKCVGYEIHEERAKALQGTVEARALGHVVSVKAANALDAPTDDGVTAVYLYLIERGLTLMLPLLRRLAVANGGTLRLVTVLYRLPGVDHEGVERVQVSDLVRTPLYTYTITPSSGMGTAPAAPCGGAAAPPVGPG